VSDGIIALSFLTIPIALLYIHKSRGESSPGETALITLFALFISPSASPICVSLHLWYRAGPAGDSRGC
jgi:hypothetical protein